MKSLRILLLLLSATIMHNASAKTIDITLTEAIQQNLVTVTSLSSGQSYNENGLSIKIENKGKKALNITIDPALVFAPEDTSYQDLIVAGDVKSVIAPSENKSITLQTYCGKSYAHGPGKDLIYHFKKQADSLMIKMLTFAKRRNINAELTQKAVWVLTNHHSLNDIYDPSNDIASKELVQFMSRLLSLGMPDYFNYYVLNKTPEETVVPKKALRIYALFKWEMKEDDKLSLGVYDEKGGVTQQIFEGQLFKVGGYELNAKFESSNEPAGVYYIRLSSGKGVIKETKVIVE
ncbi:hypothetical protein F0919_07125 [Taibaiella lutea]|uniref:T9SS type A sorting domain-containing protein n=1 Tax=Taibaiella lutea TaxID=2608001 RepID=A0A5M6CSS8_9BACT|nr:hypothetical protein [Taibaiella lutea]KAA5537440.1 hypothetical protein F0919_07125 [Taibaiella lutea]